MAHRIPGGGGFIAALALLLLLLAPVGAQTAADASAGLTIDGLVKQPLHMTLAELQSLPSQRIEVSYKTGHGEETASFTGAALWTLLERAGGVAERSGMGAKLRHTLTITGRDGYAVALSLGEIDPEFEGKPVIVAWSRNDRPLDPKDGLRLVVPGDKRGGRGVRDVVRVEVK